MRDDGVVLTCCKNNDGKEGAPSAWFRRNGLFAPNPEFDMEGFLAGEEREFKGTRVPFSSIQTAMRGMYGESRAKAAARLTSAGHCGRSTAYRILDQYSDHIVEDENGKLWWKEE